MAFRAPYLGAYLDIYVERTGVLLDSGQIDDYPGYHIGNGMLTESEVALTGVILMKIKRIALGRDESHRH